MNIATRKRQAYFIIRFVTYKLLNYHRNSLNKGRPLTCIMAEQRIFLDYLTEQGLFSSINGSFWLKFQGTIEFSNGGQMEKIKNVHAIKGTFAPLGGPQKGKGRETNVMII